MQGPDGKMAETKALIPDRTYGCIYREAMKFCQEQETLNPATMGHVANVGLMAQKAEEYGSHDKTFILDKKGLVQVVGEGGKILMEHLVEKGDIFRMGRTLMRPFVTG